MGFFASDMDSLWILNKPLINSVFSHKYTLYRISVSEMFTYRGWQAAPLTCWCLHFLLGKPDLTAHLRDLVLAQC